MTFPFRIYFNIVEESLIETKKFLKINSYLIRGQIYFHIFSVDDFITIANRESTRRNLIKRKDLDRIVVMAKKYKIDKRQDAFSKKDKNDKKEMKKN